MSLTLKVGDNDFEKLAVGTYLGTCFRMVDLGTQDTEYNGEKSKKKLIRLDFEITESLEPEGNEVNMEDGRPFGISRTYTASLFESANLLRMHSQNRSWLDTKDSTVCRRQSKDIKTNEARRWCRKSSYYQSSSGFRHEYLL